MTTRNWRLKEKKIKCPASTLCIDKYVPSTKVVKVFTENTVWNSPKRPGVALYVVVGGGGGGRGTGEIGGSVDPEGLRRMGARLVEELFALGHRSRGCHCHSREMSSDWLCV